MGPKGRPRVQGTAPTSNPVAHNETAQSCVARTLCCKRSEASTVKQTGSGHAKTSKGWWLVTCGGNGQTGDWRRQRPSHG